MTTSSNPLERMRASASALGIPEGARNGDTDLAVGSLHEINIRTALMMTLAPYFKKAISGEDGRRVTTCDPRDDVLIDLQLYLNNGAVALASGQLRGRELSEFVSATHLLSHSIASVGEGTIEFSDRQLQAKVGTLDFLAKTVAGLEGNLPQSLATVNTYPKQYRYARERLGFASELVSKNPKMFNGLDPRIVFNAVAKRAEAAQPRFLGARVQKAFTKLFQLEVPESSQNIESDFPKPARLSNWSVMRMPSVQYSTAGLLIGTAIVAGPTIGRAVANGIADEHVDFTTSQSASGTEQLGVYSTNGWTPTYNPLFSIYPPNQWVSDANLITRLEVSSRPSAGESGAAEINAEVTAQDVSAVPFGPPQQIRALHVEVDGVEQPAVSELHPAAGSPIDIGSGYTESDGVTVECAPGSAGNRRVRVLAEPMHGPRRELLKGELNPDCTFKEQETEVVLDELQEVGTSEKGIVPLTL